MSKHVPVRTVIAVAALIALAGCGASRSGAAPEISRGVGTPTVTSTAGTSTAAASSLSSGAPGKTSSSIAAGVSIPFPVAVGDTWVYQITTNLNGENGTATDRIVSAVATPGGYRVTMSETVDVDHSVTTAQPVYIFYPDGTVGFPVTGANGVSVLSGGGVRWPDAAGLASGQTYNSVLRVGVNKAGAIQNTNANVSVQGAGTAAVTVPAGTYQATVVNTAIATKLGGFTTTVEVKTWLTAGSGPVKSEVLTNAGGKTTLVTTEELLSFTKGLLSPAGS
jgi:hypothetical protein